MLNFVFVLMCVDGTPWHVRDAEIFQVMRTNEVFVRPNGEVYVLNFDEARIQYYGADGKLIRNIGRRGKGPGEFTFPTYVTLIGDFIYVFDELNEKVSIFDLKGEFQRRVSPPDQNLLVARGQGGWFFWDQKSGQGDRADSQLEWAKADFEDRTVLFKIPDTGWGAGTRAESDGVNMNISYSPMAVRPGLKVSPDGARCYFADAITFNIRVLDGSTGKQLYVISRDEKPIPFDETWADKRYEDSTERTRKRNPGVKIKKLYPEYFPAIRQMTFDPDGNLAVDRWRGRPDDNHYLVTYNIKGEEVPTKYSWAVLRRYVGKAEGHAFLLMFQEDEDAGLARVPLAEVEDFVKAHPLTDWSQSRSISISN